MKATQKIMVNQIGRIAVGSMSGLFLGEMYKAVFKSSSTPMKVVGFIGAMCTGFGVGHAIDLYFNNLMLSDEEVTTEIMEGLLREENLMPSSETLNKVLDKKE